MWRPRLPSVGATGLLLAVLPSVRAVLSLGVAVLCAIGIGVGITAGTWSPSPTSGFVISLRTASVPTGVLSLPSDSASIPSCVWNPRVTSITLGEARREGCSPLGSGRTVGVFASPANGAANYGKSDLKVDVRIARLVGSRIIVGPVFITAEDVSGGLRPLEAYSGNRSLFVYAYGQYPRPDLYRISTSSGAVLQRLTLDVTYAVMSANAFGAWFGSLDNPGPIYFVPDDGSAPIIASAGPVDVDRFEPNGAAIVADVQLAGGQPASLTGATRLWRFVVAK